MADPWVVATQEWLNTTYGSHAQFEKVDVTGKTGWATMYALTRALQIELGITTLSDNFGPGTFAAVDAISPINSSTANKNIIRIIQGGMYCKGYNGGDGELDGDYSAITIAGVQEMRTDMGLGPSNGFMTAKVLKALLTMDAFVLLDGGSSQVRTIQRTLNGRYLSRTDFYAIPADGYYSRGVQSAMMYAIQYELGMPDGMANGNFGPATKDGLRTLGNFGPGASDAASGNYLVHLFQAALSFNGYAVPFTGVFDTTTETLVRAFQSFSALPVSGRADFQTWASLLVSTGDVDRPGTAADTITTITPQRAATLVANGVETVGRYLTNSPVADPLDKNIKPGEIATIIGYGMTVVPIFQEGGDYLDYFTYSRGLYAGRKAHEAARSYGFERGTTIYFAVDFDALEEEVWSNVVPYFEGIREANADLGNFYAVGVYGARNTCSIVSGEGLAVLSYVSDMSTGFSGNLGFRLPANWAFDQILEHEIGSGDGWVNIDKNIKSGRDTGSSSIELPPSSLDVALGLDTANQSAFVHDIADELTNTMTPFQQSLASISREDAARLALEHDDQITALARSLNMRKSFLQTVLVWESAVVRIDDHIADAAVSLTHRNRLDPTVPAPAVPSDDSSTGVCQIFARTAIAAINWANDAVRRFTSLPNYDADNLDHVWEIWQRLNSDPTFNIRIAALVLLHGADLDGFDYRNLLNPSPDEVLQILGKYNGDDDYGALHRPLWNKFEFYNTLARTGN